MDNVRRTLVVLGFVGLPGAGKYVASGIIRELWPEVFHLLVPLAEPLKSDLRALFLNPLTDPTGFREALLQHGERTRKKLTGYYLPNLAESRIKDLVCRLVPEDSRLVVVHIPDVHLYNEAHWVRCNPLTISDRCFIIRVSARREVRKKREGRPDYPASRINPIGVETRRIRADYTVKNNGSIKELTEQLAKTVNDIRQRIPPLEG
jgi:dephospho-CoA kinase